MPRPTAILLVGGIVDPGAGHPGAVVAYVAVSHGVDGSRLFKVEGMADAPAVRELAPATTVDLGRFERDVKEELEPTVHAIKQAGGKAGIARPSSAWVCKHVRERLKASEGIDVD